MDSIFSFLQPSEPPRPVNVVIVPAATAEGAAPETPAVASTATAPAFASVAPTLNMPQVLQEMMDQLAGFLPAPMGGIPAPAVILLNLKDAPVGLGHFIGSRAIGPIGFTEVKGGRLEVAARFSLWGNDPAQVNAAMLLLQGNLLAARDALWNAGFLIFTAVTSSNAQFDSALNAWDRSADYSLLYEYQYENEAAQSLIARIPIHADQEVLDSLPRESTLVTDGMARWDELGTPILLARGPATFRQFAALAFIASTLPTGAVTLTRTYEGAVDPVQDFPSLGDFLVALADPVTPQRHARVSFASLADFLAQFTPLGPTLRLGDWDLDATTDEYSSLNCELLPAIQLHERTDRLEVMYADGSTPLDQAAVIYLKLVH